MRSLLTYTAARLGLFAAAFGVVYLFGARSWVALILAWLVSGLASYVLLSGMRDRISTKAVERIESRRGASVSERLNAASAREDHLQEAEGAEGAAAGQDADGTDEPGGADGEKADTGRDGSAPSTARKS
ncbi:DUF4229 domain-containing protein [Nocardiopsis halotolerans]|uniref:DUF4229 domain-containing protein n=1 Tax=Nocardiopsis halotolerans TaxID=124252 RepID=UPI000477004E|nr:DUF4229 domain-containing protein [Nocardiopsis halotolerans]